MFHPDPSLSYIAATRGQVVSIIQSINHPHVGVPGHATQPTEGTVVGIRNAGGTFSIFVHLFLTESQVPVVYTYDGGEFDVETYPDVEGEALEFVESMGFMVDNLNFRNLSPPQQEDLMARLPCFDPDPGASASEEEVVGAVVELEEVDEGVDAGWAGGDAEPLEELEEIEAIEELDEVEPLEVPASYGHAEEGVAQEVRARVGRLLASF